MTSRTAANRSRAAAPMGIAALCTLLLLFGAVGGAAAAGPTTVSSCTTIDQPGLWELSGDVVDDAATACLRITSSDVIVDGNGHTVDGVDADAGSDAVRIVGTSGARLSNVTVRNIDVTGWERAVNATYANDTAIEDLTAVDVSGDGIHFDDAGGSVTLDRVTVENSTWTGDDGIHVTASPGGGSSQAITLRNVTLDGVDYGGIELDSFGGTQTIRDTTVNDTGGHGIEVDGKPNVTLANLSVSNAGDAGLDVSTEGSATARDVTIDGTGWEGINFGSVDESIEVRNTTVTDAGWDGISLESGYDDVTVEDVRIDGSDDWGLSVDAEINATVRNVTSVDTVDGGVELAAGDGWLDVGDVRVEDVSDGWGFSAESERNLTARNVTVKNVTNGVGAEVDVSKSVTLANVSVANTTTHGGLVVDAEGVGGLTMENVSTNGTEGVGITVEEGDVTATGLDVEDANGTGILVERSTAGQTISTTNSAVNDTAGSGIEIVEGADANLTAVGVSNTSGDGVVLRSVVSAVLEDVDVADTDGDDLNLTSTTASLANLTTSTARIDGDAREVAVDATNASQRPSLPSGKDDVGSYFEASDLAADGHLNATVHYDQAAVPSDLDESTLALWRNDSSTWSEVGGTVDVSENTVSGNVTDFSVFALLGNGSSTGGSTTDQYVSGSVTDSTGSPVANASVAVVARNTSATVNATSTDGNGDFGPLSVQAGDYRVEVTKSGYEAFVSNVSVSDGETETVSATLSTYDQFVGGSVVNATGTPIRNATVSVVDRDTNATANTTTTDGNGDFGPVPVAAGDYRVEISKSGFEPVASNVAVSDGETESVAATLSTYDQFVKGSVVDETATPLGNASVEIIDDGSGSTTNTVATDGSGAFGPVPVPEGDYRVEVTKSGYRSFAANVSVADGETETVSATLTERSSSDGVGGGNGRGGSGGAVSGGSSAGDDGPESVFADLVDSNPDEPGLQVRFTDGPIEELSFGNGTLEGSGEVNVTPREGPPEGVADEFGLDNVVSSVDIEVPDGAENASARIKFRLTSRELGDHNRSTLQVVRVVGGENQRLQTTVSEDPNGGYVVEADTPGFSTFAVVAVQEQSEPATGTTSAEATATVTDDAAPTTVAPESPQTDQPTATRNPGGQDGFGVLAALVAILVAGRYASRRSQ